MHKIQVLIVAGLLFGATSAASAVYLTPVRSVTPAKTVAPVEGNQLNPQPEPPLPGAARSNPALLTELGDPDPPPSPTPSDNQLKSAELKNIEAETDVAVKNGSLILSGEINSATYTLKMEPAVVYKSLNKVVEKKGLPGGALKGLELKVENNKPIYRARVEEEGKLFGFIPFKVKSRVDIAADTNAITTVKRPWYARLISGLVDFSKIELLPNLVLTDIRFEPSQFSEGQKVKVIATVTNEGAAYAVGGLNFNTKKGPGATMYVNGYVSTWYYIFMALGPGQKQEFEFTWKKAVCGADVGVQVAKDDFIKETTKEDNSLTVKANCQ
ncbi:hypothetical protein EPN28_02050 [Patescibacteria group bacterium]|nr:MAG: hypothetical protein EPN28_02050 [Patescibacteria group bacterium]